MPESSLAPIDVKLDEGAGMLCTDSTATDVRHDPGAGTRRPNELRALNRRDGRYWARTSDLRLVETALSQLS
jgi:hypothetical protein